MSRPKSQLQFHNCLSTQFYSLFSFLTEQNKNVQKRDFLYRYVEAIDEEEIQMNGRFLSSLRLSPKKQGEFAGPNDTHGTFFKKKKLSSSTNIKKTRGVLS